MTGLMKQLMASKKAIRRVTHVIQQPAEPNSKAPLFAFGFQAVAAITGQSVFTIKRHQRAGMIQMDDLQSVADYIRLR